MKTLFGLPLHAPKRRYHVPDWKTYNKDLSQRYRLEMWLTDDVIRSWYHQEMHQKRGAPIRYSSIALMACHQLRFLFNLSFRATQGFLNSLFQRLGLNIRCPHYSQLCRRAKDLISFNTMSHQAQTAQFALVDSTGLKVYGQGEWHTKMHKASKQRTWRKFHVVVDPITHEILAHQLTLSTVTDGTALLHLLPTLPSTINRLWGDGAYDDRKIYQALYERGIHPTIPPPCQAKFSYTHRQKGHYQKDPPCVIHDNPALLPRDVALAYYHQYSDFEEGKRLWKQHSSYHLRSLVETTTMRFKQLFSDRLRARTWLSQQAEVSIKCCILNKMIQIASAQSFVKAF